MSTTVCVVWLPRIGELSQVIVEFVRSSGIEFARIENIFTERILSVEFSTGTCSLVREDSLREPEHYHDLPDSATMREDQQFWS
jgi:hypothetical protein